MVKPRHISRHVYGYKFSEKIFLTYASFSVKFLSIAIKNFSHHKDRKVNSLKHGFWPYL